MIRTRAHKFVYNPSDIGELYNLENDPWEMRNLFDLPEAQAIQDDLKTQMREHMVRVKDPILGRFDTIRHVIRISGWIVSEYLLSGGYDEHDEKSDY